MKIVRLTAENVKKLRAVEIAPTGEIVTIAGKNGQGKTSVLDAIWRALTGTKHIQGQPIRKGETKARVRLDLGELVVERKFTPTGSALSVESAEGARFPSPQRMLDALIGELSFDPLAFARMEPREQFDELRRISKLEVDVDRLDGLNRADYATRTDINRQAKAKRAQAEGIVVPPLVAGQAVDEAGLVDELQRAGDSNTAIEKERARRGRELTEAKRYQEVAAECKERAAELRAEAEKYDAQTALHENLAKQKYAKLDEAPTLATPIDVAGLRRQISAARETNNAIQARANAIMRQEALAAEAGDLEVGAQALTENMHAREHEKAQAIAAAAMPIEGIGFGEGLVTFNGLPFDQASSAEQLRISMAIAMAANPKLRVIRITDGSLLDEDSLRAIGEMAKADDFQVWIETVDSSGSVGVVIEDGAVASTPESRAKFSLQGGPQ